jgi:hypothetical protein
MSDVGSGTRRWSIPLGPQALCDGREVGPGGGDEIAVCGLEWGQAELCDQRERVVTELFLVDATAPGEGDDEAFLAMRDETFRRRAASLAGPMHPILVERKQCPGVPGEQQRDDILSHDAPP